MGKIHWLPTLLSEEDSITACNRDVEANPQLRWTGAQNEATCKPCLASDGSPKVWIQRVYLVQCARCGLTNPSLGDCTTPAQARRRRKSHLDWHQRIDNHELTYDDPEPFLGIPSSHD